MFIHWTSPISVRGGDVTVTLRLIVLVRGNKRPYTHTHTHTRTSVSLSHVNGHRSALMQKSCLSLSEPVLCAVFAEIVVNKVVLKHTTEYTNQR